VLGLVCACILLAAMGCSESGVPEERNPYYVRGVRLLEKQKHAEAAGAFEKCLRLNPDSVKAHLQLGMLHEDVFGDPAGAIYHYRRYLKKCDAAADAKAVELWLARVEKAYLEELQSRYAVLGSAAPPHVSPPAEPSSTPLAAPPEEAEGGTAPAKPSEREQDLLRRVKELSGETLGLRRQLAAKFRRKLQQDAAPAAGAPGEAASGTGGRDVVAERQPPNAAPRPELRGTVPVDASRSAGAGAVSGAPKTYIVASGDTLCKVSRKFYGSLRHWRGLRDHNRRVLKGGETLVPGMRLEIPPLAQLTEQTANSRGETRKP